MIVILTMTLLAALGSSLMLATITETAIAANYRDATEALYAADAAVEFVMQELADVADWRDVISEPARSAFVDGPPAGIRTVGAVTLDLTQATREVDGFAPLPPGVAGPRVLYAFGRFQDLASSGMNHSRIYVAVWVADRSEEPDEGTPDEGTPGEGTPVPETLSVLGQAWGGQGSRRTVEVIVTKAGSSAVRALAWREWR